MLRSERPEKPKKVYVIPKVSKKRAAAIEAGTWKPKEKKPIKARSDKRAKHEREYSKLATEFKLANPICQRCNMRPTTDLHHPGGRMGKLLTESRLFVALCRECHLYVEMHPIEAKAEGISISRLTI